MKVVILSISDVDAYDSLYIEFTEKNKNYILGVKYSPPKQSEEHDTEAL